MSGTIDKQTEDRLYVLKAFAIISAASAHCGGYAAPLAQRGGALLGTIGVPLFFLLSGLFFHCETPAPVFWRKKLRTVVLPWCIWGCLTFGLSVFLGGSNLALSTFLRWLLGCNTWLYFVPVLLICFALFRLLRDRKWIYGSIFLSLASNLLTAAGIWSGFGPFSVYQNVLNWLVFFAVGILLQNGGLTWLLHLIPRIRVLLYFGALALTVCCLLLDFTSYWSPLSIPFELLVGAVLLDCSSALAGNRLFQDVGKHTYPIFFAHMQIGIGMTNKLLLPLLPNLGAFEYGFLLIRPLCVVLLTYGLLLLGKRLAQVLHLDSWLWLLGIDRRG